MANVFIDNTKETSTLTGANWQFTNASTTVTETGAAGNAQAEVAAGDYIRTNGGLQWYEVASVTDDDNIEITPSFQQGTNTDTCKLNSENGTAVGSDYAHHNQALTDNPRAAGDIVKTRVATYTYAGIDITIDDDGDVNNPITLKGASIADDPWSDATDVRPIIDFGGGNFQFFHVGDDYWKYEHLDFTNSVASEGPLFISSSYSIELNDCRFYNSGNSIVDSGSRAQVSTGLLYKDCNFDNNFGRSLHFISCDVRIEGCVFNGDTVGGGNGTDIGIFLTSAAHVFMKDCTFGVTDAHSVADVRIDNGIAYGRNIKLASPTEVVALIRPRDSISLEDDEQTHLAFRNWQFPGILSRTTAVERSGEGGTAWSILGEPNSNCGLEQPLYIIGDWLRGIPIYLDGTTQTITMWAYADSTGGGWTPNASEFFFELDYHNGAADWQVEVTTDTFAAEDQWESFIITVTADAAGPAYLRAVLKDNVAGGKIYIDPEPVFS